MSSFSISLSLEKANDTSSMSTSCSTPTSLTDIPSVPLISSMPCLTSNEKQKLLFNVKNQIKISSEEFNNDWWPLVSNVWTQFSSLKCKNGNSFKIFICHNAQHRNSSMQQKKISDAKCRKIMIWL